MGEKKAPSVFLAGLLGYAAATAVALVAVLLLTIEARHASATGNFQILLGAGAAGAFLGHRIGMAARQRQGVAKPEDELGQFFATPQGFCLAALVLGGSGGLAALIKVGYDKLAG